MDVALVPVDDTAATFSNAIPLWKESLHTSRLNDLSDPSGLPELGGEHQYRSLIDRHPDLSELEGRNGAKVGQSSGATDGVFGIFQRITWPKCVTSELMLLPQNGRPGQNLVGAVGDSGGLVYTNRAEWTGLILAVVSPVIGSPVVYSRIQCIKDYVSKKFNIEMRLKSSPPLDNNDCSAGQ